MTKYFWISLVSTFITACAGGRVNSDAQKQAIRISDQGRLAAMLTADTTRLSKYLAESLLYTHTNGVRENKQAFLEAIAAGKYKFSEYTLDSLTYRHTPDLVVTHGSAKIQVFAFERDIRIRTRYTAVYTKSKINGWQLASWQNTKLSEW